MREQNIPSPPMSSAAMALDFARDVAAHAGRTGFKAGALVLAGALIEGIGLVMLIPLFTIILTSPDSGGSGFAGEIVRLVPGTGRMEQLLLVLAGFAAIMIVRGLLLVSRDVLLAQLLIGLVHHKRLGIIELLSNSSWEVVARLRHGRITHILGSDIHSLRSAAHFLVQGIVAAAMLATQIVLALLISPRLTALALTLSLAGAAGLWPALKRSHSLGAGITDANLSLVSNTGQFLGGLKLALSQGLQRSFVRGFGDILGEASQRETAFARQRAVAAAALTGFAGAVAAIVLVAGVGLGTPAPALIALLVVLARMNGPASVLQTGAQQILHSLPAYAKIRQLEVELGAAQQSTPRAPDPFSLAGEIRFERVTFRHRGSGSGGIFDIRLDIVPESFVGLSGPSGAGKTTFADLLAGLYPPDQGRVTVNGTPLEGEALSGWRASLSYVAQDPFLFHDTIRRNLLWARPGASEADLWHALAEAGADDLVRSMPAGLETQVGERGALVSGGERQRIALARAILRKPRLLLLDEATNAIDAEAELAILSRLRASPDRPTIILIAHRRSSLDFCERVIAFENGSVISDETHDD